MDQETVRAFLSIPFSAEFKQSADQRIQKIKLEYKNFRFLPAENWHLTLYFFGNITEEEKNKVIQALDPVASEFNPFEVTLESIGAFPDERKPRLIWAGVGGNIDMLTQLKKRIEQVLKKMKFPVEDRPFKPHMTIARLKANVRSGSVHFPATLFQDFPCEKVDSLSLMKSIHSFAFKTSSGTVSKSARF